MDINGNNTGGCKLGSGYLVYDRVDGFCENSSGWLFFVEEWANFLSNSATTRIKKDYDMELRVFTVFKSDSFHILSVC
jgi:hypothetical protein